MIYCVTGHRPGKLGGYGKPVLDRLTTLAVDVFRSVQPEVVITGMALGWDTAAALAAIECQIPFHAYVPFIGQEDMWSYEDGDQDRYRELVDKWADKVVVCSPGGYSVWKMQVRNKRMVDDSGSVIALWDGSSGGTKNCVKYAVSKDRTIVNVWPFWKRHYAKR